MNGRVYVLDVSCDMTPTRVSFLAVVTCRSTMLRGSGGSWLRPVGVFGVCVAAEIVLILEGGCAVFTWEALLEMLLQMLPHILHTSECLTALITLNSNYIGRVDILDVSV